MPKICGSKTEVYSRVCGYFRPVANWSHGKRQEFKDRKLYKYNYNGLTITPKRDIITTNN